MKGETKAQAAIISLIIGAVVFLITFTVTNFDKIAKFLGG